MLHYGDNVTIEITLYDENQNPIDLTDAQEVLLYIQEGKHILERSCSIKNPPTSGVVAYKMKEEDFLLYDTEYVFQPVVIFKNGDRLTGEKITRMVVSTLRQKKTG